MVNRGTLLAVGLGALLSAAPARLAAGPATVLISSVEVILSPVGPVVLLKAKGRAVPIFVDPVVAESIEAELGGKKPPRPLTHDLMKTVLESLDAKITKVSITLEGATFIADLRISVKGKEKVFDSRSSDAIALALRFGAPIFVGEDLLSLPEPRGQEL